MTKFEMHASILSRKLADTPAQDHSQHISAFLKSFAADITNLVLELKQKGADLEVMKSMLKDYGLVYNGKSKKFN